MTLRAFWYRSFQHLLITTCVWGCIAPSPPLLTCYFFIFMLCYLFKGGWLKFGSLEIRDASSLASCNDAVQNPSTISQLKDVESGPFYLAPTELKMLYTSFGYSEMRIMCYKFWHMRTLDVIITGVRYVNMMVSGTKTTGLCDDIRFLPGDDSYTSVQECSGMRFGGIHLIYEPYKYHVVLGNLGTRWNCDDDSSDPGYNSNGKWELYVR